MAYCTRGCLFVILIVHAAAQLDAASTDMASSCGPDSVYTPTGCHTLHHDGCFFPESTKGNQTCGWTGACELSDCKNKCVPNAMAGFDGFEDFMALKYVKAMQCTRMAGMVRQIAGMAGFSGRKILGSNPSVEKEIAQVAAHSLANRVSSFTSFLKHAAGEDANFGIEHLRHLSFFGPNLGGDGSDQPEELNLGCPTPTEVQSASGMLQLVAGFFGADLGALFSADGGDANGPMPAEPHGSAEEDDMGVAVLQMFVDFMRSPEKLKTLFTEECNTTKITTEPLLSMYASLGMTGDFFGGDGDYDAAAAPQSGFPEILPEIPPETPQAPEAIIVCRPKGDQDLKLLQGINSTTTACASTLDTVKHGQCMSEAARDQLNPKCFGAWATVLEAVPAQITQIQEAMNKIRDECYKADTQSACESVEMVEENQRISGIMDDVIENAVKQMDNSTQLSAPPPSSSDVASAAGPEATWCIAGMLVPLSALLLSVV